MSKDDEAFSAAFADDVLATSDATPPEKEVKPQTTDEGPEAGAQAEDQPAAESGDELAAPHEPEQQTATPAQPDPEQFKGYLDEREKRQKFEAEAEQLRREIEQLRQQTRQPEKPPEFDWDNPELRFQHTEQQVQEALFRQTLQQSRFFAGRDYGDEVVKEADAWARGQPQHIQLYLSQQPSPFHAAIDAMRKDKATQALAEHGYDIEKLIAARTQQAQATPQPAPPQQPASSGQPATKLPPRVTPSGAVTEAPKQTDDQVFRSVFS